MARVILSLALPGIVAVTVLSFTLAWNERVYAYALLPSSPHQTVSVGVASQQSDLCPFGGLMAGALLGMLPMVLLYWLFADRFAASLAMGEASDA